MDYTCIFLGLLFTAAGLAFAFGKAHIHLAAWKSMPQEERETVRIRPLCRNIGEVIALNGLIFLGKGLWAGFERHWFVCAILAWLVIAGIDVWYITKSGRYCAK